MPAEIATGGTPRTKPPTRTSIRQSLNLSSVGKALGDIMNKDSDKAKKPKEAASRRLSAVNLMHATSTSSRSSLELKPSPVKGRGTPDQRTITSKTRRSSAVHKPISEPAEDQRTSLDSTNPRQSADSTRYPLRSRNSLASSALPKYRPKSVLVDTGAKQPPSPLRAGIRRRLSQSDDETEKAEPKRTSKRTPRSSIERMAKPISPLPHRATFRLNVTTVNMSPSPTHPNSHSPASSKVSPPRPLKAVKTASSASAPQSAIPRPPSSTSSASPRTPKVSSLKSALGLGKSSREKTGNRSSPLRTTTCLAAESPLGHRKQKSTKNELPSRPKSRPLVSRSHISEGDAEDSDEADVALLLAPVAPATAPTPAMPRIRSSRNRTQSPPQTPSRTNTLPSRTDLSYRSPFPPDIENAPLLQPQLQNDVVRSRGSILSWEQLATEASKTLDEGEINSMLSDIPAPFAVEPVSPNALSMPGSPCLSAIHSPDRFASISHILLPDVTPSPAIHNHTPKYDNPPSEVLAVDAAIVTLLRLQLAAAENTGNERLHRLQSLEEELHDVKETKAREAEVLTRQITHLKEQLRGKTEVQEEERAAYIAGLEEQVRRGQAHLGQVLEAALQNANVDMQREQENALKSERRRWDSMSARQDASMAWARVHDIAESELDRIRADMQTLTVLLAGLDHCNG